MPGHAFDVIVIGAGPAGEVAAGRIAERSDLTVAIVEEELVGGECSFYACMPSKALLRPQELRKELERVPGVCEDPPPLDVDAILARRDEVIYQRSDDAHLPWLEKRKIELIRGKATLDGERRVLVGEDAYEARKAVVIATGSKASLPPIDGLSEAKPWTNREATTAEQAPASLIVLGGGPVGVEMAQAWRSLGCEVTVIEAESSLLPSEEPLAGEALMQALREDGVDVRVGTKAKSVRRQGEQTIVTLDDGDEVSGERLLVAIGRKPRTEGIGIESVGLVPGKPIEVDEHLRCAAQPWLYAVGDVNGRVLLTHMGKYQARIVADAIMGVPAATLRVDGHRSPRVTFTEPQVAATGHTLASAKEAGIAAKAIDLPTSGSPGASFHGRETPGTTRFVLDTDRDVLVGATFVGFETAEMLQAASIAIAGEVPLSTLVHAIPAFPTRSELWLAMLEDCGY
jgi:pyruvate/2-oxoglutarate dehydrogenase complex dihydrolipoamide dehydrogenase (E3) component